MKFKDINKKDSVLPSLERLIRFTENFDEILLDFHFSKFLRDEDYDVIRSYDFMTQNFIYYTLYATSKPRIPIIHYVVRHHKLLKENLTQEESTIKDNFYTDFNIKEI